MNARTKSAAVFLTIGVFLASCALPGLSSSQSVHEYAQVAVDFAAALLMGDYELAHTFLSPELKETLTPADLHVEFTSMYAGYSDTEPTQVLYDPRFSLKTWPGKHANDLGWYYVSVLGDDFVEAVAVVVSSIDGEARISEIEWGRP